MSQDPGTVSLYKPQIVSAYKGGVGTELVFIRNYNTMILPFGRPDTHAERFVIKFYFSAAGAVFLKKPGPLF